MFTNLEAAHILLAEVHTTLHRAHLPEEAEEVFDIMQSILLLTAKLADPEDK